MASKKGKWVTVGRLWKNPSRPDRLKGTIEIKHLGIKMNVHGFIKTDIQKRSSKEEDLRISMLIEVEEGKSIF